MNTISVLPILTEGNTLHITSPFGERTDPVSGKSTGMHKGIDVTLWRGWSDLSGIGAAWGGTVSDVRDSVAGFDTVRTAGNRVSIDHGNGIVTKYFHLKKGSIPVKIGDKVAAGERIGEMGSTGYSTGAHLHFQLEIGGKAADPLPYLTGEKKITIPEAVMDNIPASWAEDAVKWAVECGILRGDETGNYRLRDNCTREMMLVFLHRAQNR